MSNRVKAADIGLVVLFHPTDAFVMIKRQYREMSLAPVLVVFSAVIVLRYLTILLTHQPMIGVKIGDTDILLELAVLLLPPFTWALSIYGLTSVSGGETALKEIVLTIAYCFVPYLILTPFQILLSRLLTQNEQGLYSAIQTIMWIWICVLLFVSMIQMNDFSLIKGLGITVVSLIGVVLIWIVLVLVFAFTLQIVLFVRELLVETGVLTL